MENKLTFDINFRGSDPISRGLDNHNNYHFKFRGKRVKSMAGLLQALKFKDIKKQNSILKISGITAYYIERIAPNWQTTGDLYWQGETINRFSDEYQAFLFDAYKALSEDIIFRALLLGTEEVNLTCKSEKDDKNATILTEEEFIKTLEKVRNHLINEKNSKKR